ncbi:MAG: tRNA lysidine(34) synthetase TilS, partial [Peptostreptococcales bacterium]
ELNGSKDVSTIHLENLLRLIDEGETSKGIDWPNGLRIELGYDAIIFYKDKKHERGEWSYELVLNEENRIETSDEWISFMPRIIMKEDYQQVDHSKIKAFDFDKIKGKIEIRNRRMGDYITPSGMKGSKKLKEYFIDEKIPRDIRYRIPLMCTGSEVIWIIGYRTNENYRVREETERILLVELKNQCCNLAEL